MVSPERSRSFISSSNEVMTTQNVGWWLQLKPRLAPLMQGGVATRIEVIVAMMVIGIVFLLILPIPAWLLDCLIALNLFIAGFLIVLSLYIPGLTSFSTFPTILLLTTLFRLGISVATTRMILLYGDAGNIVETFGNFVVGGNVVVGLVVFLIVTVVQFIVLTKGAERMAEVSARFSLDAMPAKQLGIEGELRAQLIDQAEAKRLRAMLDSESQLLGAMDGAMKFVKGDAIAGLIIVAINLIGGLGIGVAGLGMTVEDAIQHYSVLTIGDGLVAQIPALLISMTAAILITRGSHKSSATSGNLGSALAAQLLGYPKAFGMLASIMSLFALIPGMPSFAFGTLAAVAGGAAFYGVRKEKTKPAENDKAAKRAETSVVHEFNQMDALQLALPKMMDGNPETPKLVSAANAARNKLVIGLGMTLPNIEVKYFGSIAEDAIEFRVYEVPVMRGRLAIGQVAVGGRHADAARALGGAVVEAGGGMGGADVVWLPSAVAADARELQGVTQEWQLQLAERIEQKLVRYGPRFTGIQAAQKYLNWMEEWMPELAKELQKAVPSSKYAEIIQRLLRERISVRNMRLIMETLADVGQRERDSAALAEHVRFALREQICHQLAPDSELPVYVLEPELEEYLSSHVRQAAGGGFLALTPQSTNEVISAIRHQVKLHQAYGRMPVLVCAPDIRRYVRTMLDPEFPEMNVLAVNELMPEIRVTVLATVAFPDSMGDNGGSDEWDDDNS